MTDDLSNTPWHVGDIFTVIDDRIDYWNGLMNYIINYHAPTTRKGMRENDVPYMTSDWKKAIRKKRLFVKLYAKGKTEENFELKRKYRNLATKECKKVIKQFWKMKSEKIRENPRDFFNTFQPFITKKTVKNNPITLNVDGNDTENDAVAVANRPIRLTQCCTQFKSPGVKILCVLYLHYNVAFTLK